MKIGINSRSIENENTGIPYFIQSLYNKLQKIDKKNQYLFFQTKKNKIIGSTKTINVIQNNLGSILFDNLVINRLIQKEKINIFHSPAHILPLIKIKGIKYLVTIHDLSFLASPELYPKIFSIYYSNQLKITLKNADLIIADSYNTKIDIVKYYDIKKEKIKVVYLGINEVFFKEIADKPLFKFDYFFSITTHPKRKNILTILDIFKQSNILRKYKYIIAGLIPKHSLQELKNKIKRLCLEKKVIIFGYATEEELKNLYQNAKIFIYPSFYEGFGLPVLEAMACKCPVIASNTSSVPEIFPAKKWLINPYNHYDIYNKIDKMINLSQSEKNNLIKKNYDFAKKFTWENTAKSYLKIFNQL